MKNTAISTYELFRMFPDEKAAREKIESVRWVDGVYCPDCGGIEIYSRKGKREGYHDCRDCGKHFTVRTGTIFEKSHVPLHKWIYAIYIIMTARKGVSSMQLSKETGVTQKTAWFLGHRLRLACGGDYGKLAGIVEIDETYIGGKEANKHNNKRHKGSQGGSGKAIVLGMRERGGKTKAMPIKGIDSDTLHKAIHDNIKTGTTIYTDELRGYNGVGGIFYKHEKVNHSAKEYVNGMASTNGIESVWALLKRGYHGTYHQFSRKHLRRYVDEFSFRLNEGNVTNTTIERLDAMLKNAMGKRLTYAELTQ